MATNPAFATSTGGFFVARGAKPLDCPPAGRDEQLQRELWQATADFLQGVRRSRR
ncbi:hypothetical protein [Kitasatospora sp. MAP5-34]|uniref:hypothetical protein n=1 Tax=Kitasatospora sp. MAP5-34 TaxID=3035102 RepID=UPI002474575B|nr:hypothetical protein [Kitasatospora sp. MAP5-34]MDH6578223.1 hypothetical protein [Kitasatospora sp. MAP5-34]